MAQMSFTPQPDNRNWLDRVNDSVLNFLFWIENSKSGKWFRRAGWFFLILAILWLFVKTIYDLHNDYTPSL